MGLLSGNTKEVVEDEVVEETKPKRKPYHLWKVGEEEFKLKLTTQEIVNIESKIGTNLLSVISKTEDGCYHFI